MFKMKDLEEAVANSKGALVINNEEFLDILNISNISSPSSFKVFGYCEHIKDHSRERIYPGEDYKDCSDYFVDTTSYVVSASECHTFSNDVEFSNYLFCPIVEKLVGPDEYRKAVFLDRDGVINIDHGYVYQPEKLDLIPGVIDFLQICEASNILKLVVTNQAGVARGLFTEADVAHFHDVICERLSKEGITIDAIEIAPYHFQNGHGDYKKHSFTRKPGIAMVYKHLYRFSVDLSQSWMIGDKPSDILNIDLLNYLLLRGDYNLSPYDSMVYDDFEGIKTYLFSLDFLHQA
ncbi:D,D-heptose 1,7-bisphosphate phosphatase [Bacteriovorax sp. Seq25_V]|nr:D,D-heptose 1,7-bisphosphate phosphatase [Bacteriovorax sp. Seq25_V]